MHLNPNCQHSNGSPVFFVRHFFYFNFMLKRRSHRVRKLIIVDSNKIFAILSDKKWQKKKNETSFLDNSF